MAPDEDQIDRLFADEAADQAEAVDLEEFGSYGPVVACAVVMAFIVLAIVQMLLFSFGAPSWVGRVLMLLYVTLPQGAVLVWAWGKPAVRLPSGMVLPQRRIRLYIGMVWVASILLIGLQMARH
ncbi:hypothetical protein [Sphingobium yanoikuyae]|jgi:hypothetical protein|uniref:Uncharacterized protein n=1 Tax=Sphingobium yanoikuyae TaxID=13690 RepID=A0A430C645_SPHYA|nr:hypothetical protein [Sphingobium yanoikuyae]RSU60449.1 hypothetical protein DAH51_06040 [Sphingobium yanoikuyae]